MPAQVKFLCRSCLVGLVGYLGCAVGALVVSCIICRLCHAASILMVLPYCFGVSKSFDLPEWLSACTDGFLY